jgi:hypothetical protein
MGECKKRFLLRRSEILIFRRGERDQDNKFDIRRTVQRDVFLEQNQRGVPISIIFFRNRTLHVSDSFSVNHQESSTVHTAIGIRGL